MEDEMVRILFPAAGAALTLSLAVPATGEAQEVHRSAYHDYRVETVVEGLVRPWSIAFLPGGDMLVTELPGRLRIVRDGRLLPDPVPGVPEVRAEGQGGLLDVVPHPDFASNRFLYLSFAKPSADGTRSTTGVVRGRFVEDRLTDVEEIFEAQKWSEGRGHYGSRLAFDGNGYLFVSLGDRQVPPSGDLEKHPAQLLTDHMGTVVRLHDDGRVPEDNPFVGHGDALPEIWSYGHRNAQGLVYDPATGNLWLNEHGPAGGDEVNLIRPGLNYGWPVVGYGVHYRTGAAIHAATQGEGMENPAHIWVPSIATSGMLLYTGDRFPSWKGSLFVGGLAGEVLSRLTLDGERITREETLVHDMGRIRDVRQGPDGSIYLAIDERGEGRTAPIYRLVPAARN